MVSKNAQGLGMVVSTVMLNGKPISFQPINDHLTIQLSPPTLGNEQLTFEISYRGIPIDGLIIGKNKFGDRGFYGDNRPRP